MKNRKALKIGIAVLGAVILVVVAVLIGGRIVKKNVPVKDNGTVTDAIKDDTTEKVAKEDITEETDDKKQDYGKKEDSDKKDETGKDKSDRNDKNKKEDPTEKDKDNKKEESTTEAKKDNGRKEESTTEAKKTDNNKKKETTTESPKGNDGGNKQTTTEAPKKETTTEAPKKETSTEAPKQEASCNHTWVWKTHTVHHDAEGYDYTYLICEAYDEPVYVNDIKCNCGAIFPSDAALVAAGHAECGGCMTHQSISGYIHHDAEYGSRWIETSPAWDEVVNDYQYCSKCGQRK